MNLIMCVSVCFVLLLASSPACATVTVREGVNTNPPGVTRQFIMGTNKWQVTIVRSDNAPIILTIEGTANDTIEWIRATNNGAGSADIQLIVGVEGPSGIGNIEEISKVGNVTDRPVSIISMRINGSLGRQSGGSINGVRVNRFQGAIIGAHLHSPIDMQGTGFGNQPNNVTFAGNVYTRIYNGAGPIGSIVIEGDMIGLPPPVAPINIWTPQTIDSVRVRGMHNATIGHAFSFDSLDSIALLEVTNSVTTDTPVPGEGTAGVLAQSIGTVKIGGDFGCTLRVEGGLPNDPNQPSIQIGGSLLDAGEIILPASGLKSQIIVNSNASSGAWTGDVIVGGVVLSPLTTYDNLPSAIGGGAAGRVQFTVHKKASVPDVSGTGPFEVGENGPIVLVHYGPVIDPMTGNTPYVITRTPVTGGTPLDVSLCFDQLRDPVNHTIMSITPKSNEKMLRGYKYSLAPRSGVLRCDLPSGTGTAVAAYGPFAYAVCPEAGDALGDADNSGLVDFADITEVLADFGVPVLCSSLGDADRSGTIDFADVTSVLTNWLAEYCLTLGSSSGDPAGDGFATMGLDGELSAAEAIGNITDALAQMGYASPEAFSDAISQMTTEVRDAEIRRLGALLQGSN